MFNIGKNTKINGLENVRSLAHLQHQLYEDKEKEINYTCFGSIVRKGTVKVTTADGVVFVDFDVKNGWAREITIRKAVNEMNQIKFCISMTKDLYAKVKAQAKAKELTVASFIRLAVIDYMERG